jgi:long-chain fatty acid transport protein
MIKGGFDPAGEINCSDPKLKNNLMRKILTFICAAMITGSLFAGGLVTNTNQSAMYTRLQNRNASTEIDAVYFNPAGLTKLEDGFHLSINNQFIQQTQTIGNSYNYLSGTKPREYVGKVSAPIYPGVYLALNKGRFSVSGGFNVIGGGGGAKFDTGLPGFEMPISDLVPGLSSQLNQIDQAIFGATGTDPGFKNISGYSADIFFEGSSVYFGYQANVAFEINEMISAAVGGRLISAKNTYSGYIKNAEIGAPVAYGGSQAPGDYLRFIAGVPGMDAGTADLLNGTAGYLDVATNVEADAEMKGLGFTPIISVNISPDDNFNLALRYEFKTKLNLKTTVLDNKDGGIFIQDSVAVADMPAQLSIGANFKPLERLMLSGSFNYYLDKKVDYDGQEDVEVSQIDKNFIEFGLGAEYSVNDKLRLSAGWVTTKTGVNSNYQSEMGYSTNTNSFGAGIGYRITPMLDLNIGGQYTLYDEDSKDFNHYLGIIPINVTETYNKETWLIGVGLNFYFGK